MHFTRDPIIETIMTPKEGHKLAIRSSSGTKSEEYLVDAVEVITFGNVYFLRSLERPKAFLLPLSDYEVIEVREMKVPLQATSYEKAIKIPSKKGGKSEEKRSGKRTKKQRIETNVEESNKKKEIATESTIEAREEKAFKKSKRTTSKKKQKANLGVNREQKILPPPATLIS